MTVCFLSLGSIRSFVPKRNVYAYHSNEIFSKNAGPLSLVLKLQDYLLSKGKAETENDARPHVCLLIGWQKV